MTPWVAHDFCPRLTAQLRNFLLDAKLCNLTTRRKEILGSGLSGGLAPPVDEKPGEDKGDKASQADADAYSGLGSRAQATAGAVAGSV